jgi:hypothetical protein
MIQRIQTVWLFICALFTGLIAKTGILNFTGIDDDRYLLGFSGLYRLNDLGRDLITRSWLLPPVIILIVLLSVIAILSFGKRKIQKTFTLIVAFLTFLLIVITIWYIFAGMNSYDAKPQPGLRILFPVVSFIASLLALRSINKDEELIRSYDRLR